MRYRHRLRITRPSAAPGVVDPETGDVSGGGATQVILDCPAIVHDGGQSVARHSTGQPWLEADATAIVPPRFREAVLAVEPLDNAEVFYPNSDRKAEGSVKVVRDVNRAVDLVYR